VCFANFPDSSLFPVESGHGHPQPGLVSWSALAVIIEDDAGWQEVAR
jgi:hypothetical protein